MVWSVSEGYYNNGDAWNNPTPYPGDNYVDWVASSGYNHNSVGCLVRPPRLAGAAFGGSLDTRVLCAEVHPRGVEYDFRGRKPYHGR